jgi:DNA-binding NtrC family response regulator
MESKPKILVVDDEKIVCDMARRCLELEGYEVTTFTDSTQALAALGQQRFDVMITDLKMKEVDGLRLLEFVRENWPETKVIMLTAFATLETAMEAFHKQAFDYFTKPVRIDDLKASVARALKERTTDSGEDATRGPTGEDHD